MLETIHYAVLGMVAAPLIACAIVGLLGTRIAEVTAHRLTIAGVSVAFLLSLLIIKCLFLDGAAPYDKNWYVWGVSGEFQFSIGFLVDKLSAVMFTVVSFIALLVHIYSIGYMHGDPSYRRFFCYISLFTFAMLMLVGANNFLQLYFGWEGVGLASYLLIGFWFKRDSANFASLKAFLINRVGDFGFLLGIAAIFNYFNAVEYRLVFADVPAVLNQTLNIGSQIHWPVITVICLCLFIGAMGKSAQVPLHVWLPESMEGPTPISALIHAATMVTAGVYMVARMSPLYEYSETALSVVLITGATGALFLGLVAFVQNDIKRIVAYSTLSQLGYMVAALGVSAFSAAVFHLFTHAFFKALLFLGAGSVIIAMHHDQDIRNMGGLGKYLPITYVTFLIGSLALIALPPFAGFYSKDAIIEAVHQSNIFGSSYAYYCILLGTFVTAFYSFRAFFLVFHTKPRWHQPEHPIHEAGWVIWLPLVILAVPSAVIGILLAQPFLYQGSAGLLGNAVFVLPQHDVLAELAKEYQGGFAQIKQALGHWPFWLTVAGLVSAGVIYLRYTAFPAWLAVRCRWLYAVLNHKYGFDEFYQGIFVKGSQAAAAMFYKIIDLKCIDGWLVNGSGHFIKWCSQIMRRSQSGYLYHYALVMIVALLIFLGWLLVPFNNLIG